VVALPGSSHCPAGDGSRGSQQQKEPERNYLKNSIFEIRKKTSLRLPLHQNLLICMKTLNEIHSSGWQRGSDHQRKVSPVPARVQDCPLSSGATRFAALFGVRSADAGFKTPTG
jgi:hypothetical protein